jgi:hypothetical protein
VPPTAIEEDELLDDDIDDYQETPEQAALLAEHRRQQESATFWDDPIWRNTSIPIRWMMHRSPNYGRPPAPNEPDPTIKRGG